MRPDHHSTQGRPVLLWRCQLCGREAENTERPAPCPEHPFSWMVRVEEDR
jgi:rubrerythrin